MSFPNAPRRGKDNARRDHFGYYELERGKEVYGYLAGPVLWLEMHQSDLGSKPCLEKLTGGELSCPRCKSREAVQKGACPWWHEFDHKPYMFWLDDGRREIYEKLAWGRRLKFARDRVKGAPVWAAFCTNQEPQFRSEHPYRKGPQDVTRSLLRMFKMPELDLWYAATHGASDKPVSLPDGRAVKEDGKPFSPMHQGPAKRWGADVVPPTIETDLSVEYLAALQARGKVPSKNGKHKPEG